MYLRHIEHIPCYHRSPGMESNFEVVELAVVGG
jgi:hypothetical protein